MSVHTIRLREPWGVQALPDGRTEYRRRFGQPRRWDEAEAVWLVCSALPGDVAILLNGEAIPNPCDVTSRLLPRNEVVISTSSPLGDVQLEISTAD